MAQPEAERSTVDQIFDSLCETHACVLPHHKALAWRIAQALCAGGAGLAEAIRALPMLPTPKPPPKPVADPTTGRCSTLDDKLWGGILSVLAADRTALALKAERGETLSEREQLQLRLAQLDEAEAAGEDAPPAVVEPAAQARLGEPPKVEDASASTERVLDPPLSAITPPSENANLARNQRAPVYPDDGKHQPGPIIDAEPVKAASSRTQQPVPAPVPSHEAAGWDAGRASIAACSGYAGGGYDNWWTSGPFARRTW